MLIMVFLSGVFLIWPPFFRFRTIFSIKMVFISCVFVSRNESIVQFGTIAMVLWCGVYVWKVKMVLWWMVPLWCFMVPGTGLLETVSKQWKRAKNPVFWQFWTVFRFLGSLYNDFFIYLGRNLRDFFKRIGLGNFGRFEFDFTWCVLTSWTFLRPRAVFSSVFEWPWLAHSG